MVAVFVYGVSHGQCNILKVINNRNPIRTDYQLHGHNLQEVQSAVYLGVTISNKMKWDAHIRTIIGKANMTLGFLRRNVRVSSITI